MAHIVIKTDSKGDTIELVYYCSDTCAKSDTEYAGWYGCVEIATESLPQFCGSCNSEVR